MGLHAKHVPLDQQVHSLLTLAMAAATVATAAEGAWPASFPLAAARPALLLVIGTYFIQIGRILFLGLTQWELTSHDAGHAVPGVFVAHVVGAALFVFAAFALLERLHARGALRRAALRPAAAEGAYSSSGGKCSGGSSGEWWQLATESPTAARRGGGGGGSGGMWGGGGGGGDDEEQGSGVEMEMAAGALGAFERRHDNPCYGLAGDGRGKGAAAAGARPPRFSLASDDDEDVGAAARGGNAVHAVVSPLELQRRDQRQ